MPTRRESQSPERHNPAWCQWAPMMGCRGSGPPDGIASEAWSRHRTARQTRRTSQPSDNEVAPRHTGGMDLGWPAWVLVGMGAPIVLALVVTWVPDRFVQHDIRRSTMKRPRSEIPTEPRTQHLTHLTHADLPEPTDDLRVSRHDAASPRVDRGQPSKARRAVP